MEQPDPSDAEQPRAACRQLADLCLDARPQCAVVLAANAGLVGIALSEPFSPALLLHAVLLPINVWRLLRALRAGPSAAVRAAAAVCGEAAALKRRVAVMRCQRGTPSALMQTVRLQPRARG